MAIVNFSSALTWLYKGIGLDVPATLTQLDARAVQPVLDVFQDGWGVAVYRMQQEVEVGAGAAMSDTLGNFNPDPDITRVVLSCSVRNVDVAAGMTLNLFKQRVSISTMMATSGALASGARASWAALAQGAPFWVFEPGTSFLWTTNGVAVAAGQTFEIIAAYAELPSGFKPI